MTKQKKDKYSNVSILKKIVVIFIFFASLFGGMFAAIVAVDKYKNYLHPYGFTFLFGTIGFVLGLYIAKSIKTYVILNIKMFLNYSLLAFQFSVGFFGWFMFFGYYLNSNISTLTKCDEFTVVDTEHIEDGYRRPEFNILYVNIDGKIEPLHCSANYYNRVSLYSSG